MCCHISKDHNGKRVELHIPVAHHFVSPNVFTIFINLISVTCNASFSTNGKTFIINLIKECALPVVVSLRVVVDKIFKIGNVTLLNKLKSIGTNAACVVRNFLSNYMVRGSVPLRDILGKYVILQPRDNKDL